MSYLKESNIQAGIRLRLTLQQAREAEEGNKREAGRRKGVERLLYKF